MLLPFAGIFGTCPVIWFSNALKIWREERLLIELGILPVK
jgi:hypothetical protein